MSVEEQPGDGLSRKGRKVAADLARIFSSFRGLPSGCNQPAHYRRRQRCCDRGRHVKPKLIMFDEPSLGLAQTWLWGELSISSLSAIRDDSSMVERNALAALEISIRRICWVLALWGGRTLSTIHVRSLSGGLRARVRSQRNRPSQKCDRFWSRTVARNNLFSRSTSGLRTASPKRLLFASRRDAR